MRAAWKAAGGRATRTARGLGVRGLVGGGKAGRAVTGRTAGRGRAASCRLARARAPVPVETVKWRRGKDPPVAIKCIHIFESGLAWVGGFFVFFVLFFKWGTV